MIAVTLIAGLTLLVARRVGHFIAPSSRTLTVNTLDRPGHRTNEVNGRLEIIRGVGVVTATAITALARTQLDWGLIPGNVYQIRRVKYREE
jgi:hypothetical protein